MKLVSAALKEKGIKPKDLSDNLKQELDSLQNMIVKYNEACEEYEKEPDTDTETEDNLNTQESYIASAESELADKIKALVPAAAAAAAAPAAAAPAAAPAAAKKEDSVGWLIFGAVVLVVTVGAVNILKKK